MYLQLLNALNNSFLSLKWRIPCNKFSIFWKGKNMSLFTLEITYSGVGVLILFDRICHHCLSLCCWLSYILNIFLVCIHFQARHRPKAGYMTKQHDITYSMRSILVDWLVEVAEEYRLQTETLYLAVSYIDRFLSYMSVVRAKLQLVGTAAMFIAAWVSHL